MVLCNEGHATHTVMREAGVAKTTGRRRQGRFMPEGAGGLLRHKTWSSRIRTFKRSHDRPLSRRLRRVSIEPVSQDPHAVGL
jgi:hypothetical protein